MTVSLLVIGLVAAGVGTAVFLRGILISNVGTQIDTLARTDASASLIELSSWEGELRAELAENPPLQPDYHVAVYSNIDGRLLAAAGKRGGSEPVLPDYYTLDSAYADALTPEILKSADGESEYLATVSVQQYAPGGILYPQVVALPLAGVNRTIATYLGIYAILAIIIIVVGAFLTRSLVTLTFRSLGQVESTADIIASGDFSQRMTDIEPTTTEVGRLKTAINAMLGRVDAAISDREATVRQMRRFIGDASHELRTPLVTVRGYAELYRMGAISGDDDVAQAMDRIESEAKRMGLLVEDLLALARLDERRDVVVAPVDLRPIARDAALDVRATSPLRAVTVIDTTARVASPVFPVEVRDEASAPDEKRPSTSAIARAGASLSLLRRKPRPVPATKAPGVGADLVAPIHLAPVPDPENEVRGGVPPIVLGDENRIRQVVTNLLGNARRFTADDSPIELHVGVDQAARTGWIQIVDHGEGVPDQIKKKIFQRFWRADTSRTRETGGSGLGLSIVASIVEALQGTVAVFDTPGGGATFRVTLPLIEGRDIIESLQRETQPITRPTGLG